MESQAAPDMSLQELFVQARITKDSRFDGRFLFGVTTTGIFCRPSCPSPTANEENVRYFETLFEALKNGFRPCLRCRPDISLGYYSNRKSEDVFVVKTALQMIYEGYLNDRSIADLAAELLISDRHLRQLFVDTLGVPPVTIAGYHKSLFAKKLLLYSRLTITDIAFASGYRSLRQFNDGFKKLFNQTPKMIREMKDGGHLCMPGTKLLLKYQKAFSWNTIISFLQPRTIQGVEGVTCHSYSRSFRIGKASGFFTVTDKPHLSALELQVDCDDITCYMELYSRVRRMFDLDTDFDRIHSLFQKEPLLATDLNNGHVPRLPVTFSPFECVIRAILGQQISVKAATTLAGRIAEQAGVRSSRHEGITYFFPEPEELINLNLEGIGIPAARQITIKTVCRALLEGRLKLSHHLPFDTFAGEFTALKGIGDWTANYVAMRGLGHADAFPTTDLGIIKALTKTHQAPSQKQIAAIAEKWRPYRSYAALCLWNSLNKKEIP